jgi:hypothetical protein
MNRWRRACALAAGLLFPLVTACGASPYNGLNQARSASGQFIVTFTQNTSWLYHRPEVGLSTNKSYLSLEPSLLAISAERFKTALWRTIGLPADTPWSGKIFIALHAAVSTNENVVIATDPFIQYWNYRLEMPDLINRTRYARALSAVLLMELANRQTPVTRSPAIIPPWLADGLARQIEEADTTQVILSAPARKVNALAVTQSGPSEIPNGLALTRVNLDRHGIDPLAASREVLQNHAALTFNQLCWPDNAQEDGADGGVYLASAQLFVCDLLQLPGGPGKVRNLLERLPQCNNWQTAFFAAFRADFESPLAVEKWWSLRVVSFAARDPGPLWTLAVSRQKLDDALSVPVDVRYASNALPRHAEISLQAAIRSFAPPHQTAILETKLRDLNLIQLRLAAQVAPIGNAYRVALADFLADWKAHTWARHRRSAAQQFIYRLDTLDQRRQELETRLERQKLPGPDPQ